ncbi:hypothetical protein C7271_14880 [filamentous cyanobacterium CCP5]|nr:hypothetical protein C7271_14880 [filamentous cyanobacterium CCP5]
MICECKAYQKPVDINAWLKFLGKLFTAEKSRSQVVYGCFVALNGVNGNVAGHYKDLSLRVDNIELVSGESLLKHISNIYTLCDLEKVKKVIQIFTNRQALSFEEIAYYKNKVFRIITFEGNSYTLLSSNGEPISRAVFDSELKNAVQFVLPAISFIDLQEEAEAIKRATRAQKFVMSHLLLNNGSIEINSILCESEFTSEEIIKAIERLQEQAWLYRSNDSEILLLKDEDGPGLYTILTEIYRFLLAGDMTDSVLEALASEYYLSHINEDFISQIQQIQGGMILSPEEVQQVILLLKWSPTALAWSLYPNEMLVNYSVQKDLVDMDVGERGDLLCRNYFLSVLYVIFKSNFRRPELHNHFYNIHGLREIETIERLIVKSHTGIEFQGELELRQAIIPLDMGSDAEQLVMAIPFNSSSEPWESTSESIHESND